ncbi:MAG TPA: prepilin-type N-terminal cleavage/methylation domain-containing protein [Candidatus Acidoferrum sp.]|nr:prepilin-type N-terminal cleavage/methylation domain-containing protein [Candidatus Acidoferrum sp.]
MAASQFNKTRKSQRGFTLLETLGAIAILSIGLLAMAGLMSKTTVSSSQSRYMSAASILATQKLEELNRYPISDPVIAVSGSSAGSITGDVSSGSLNYFDNVQISAVGGTITETTEDDQGNYTTITQSPDGTITSATSTTAPAPLAETLRYHRRWVIEKDVPVTGVRRITVFVQLTNPPIVNSVTFQISMVRP